MNLLWWSKQCLNNQTYWHRIVWLKCDWVQLHLQPGHLGGHNNAFQSDANEFPNTIIDVKGLLPTLRTKERMAMTEGNTVDSQRQKVANHLKGMPSKFPGFQAGVDREGKDGFIELSLRLPTSLSSLERLVGEVLKFDELVNGTSARYPGSASGTVDRYCNLYR